MMTITHTKTHIILNRSGCEVASVLKEKVHDFSVDVIGNNGVIDFDLYMSKPVRFALPKGEQFDNALLKLINITDGMGI